MIARNRKYTNEKIKRQMRENKSEKMARKKIKDEWAFCEYLWVCF